MVLLFACLQTHVHMEDWKSSYVLHLPSAYDERTSWPVIVDLAGDDGWFPVAEKRGYLVIVPRSKRSESAFVKACLDDAKTKHWIDPGRTLLAGAEVAIGVATERPDVFGGCALFQPTGRVKTGKGPPICVVDGKEWARRLKEAGNDVTSIDPSKGARGGVLDWFEQKVRRRGDVKEAVKYVEARRFLDASLVLMGLIDRAELKPQVKWELGRVESHGLFELGKVLLARSDRRYSDAYLRCRRAAIECAWLPVGERLRKRLAELKADPRVRRALERGE